MIFRQKNKIYTFHLLKTEKTEVTCILDSLILYILMSFNFW